MAFNNNLYHLHVSKGGGGVTLLNDQCLILYFWGLLREDYTCNFSYIENKTNERLQKTTQY